MRNRGWLRLRSGCSLAWPERRRRIRPQRGVDGIEDEEFDIAAGGADAGVPLEATRAGTAQTSHQAHIANVSSKARRKTSGKALVEQKEIALVLIDESLGLVEAGVQRGHFQVRGINVVVQVEIGYGPLIADAKYAAARRGGARSAKEKASFGAALGPAAKAISFSPIAEINSTVEEGVPHAVEIGAAPNLRRLLDRIAPLPQRRRIGALAAADGWIALAVFDADVEKTVLRKRQADISCGLGQAAVAFEVLAGSRFHQHPFEGFAQSQIQHSGDGVGPVLGCRAVAQQFHLRQGNGRDHAQIRPLRSRIE